MKCVIKGTTIQIDSLLSNSVEIMLQNALNAGFSEAEVEILTEEEYQERKALEPQPIPTSSLEERLLIAEETINVILGL